MITIKELAIPDVKVLTPKLHQDDRGYVTEIVNEKRIQELGLTVQFMQENQTMTLKKHTVRGLHCQKSPHAQAKLVRVLRGKILDVAVDIRPNSKTFGQHVSEILSEDEVCQMFVPIGFLHGFCTLEDNTVVLYKMSNLYAPESEVGVIWDDPALKIKWPVSSSDATVSPKDKKLLAFKDLPPIHW